MVESLERQIQQIQERNQRVETDKAWETSAFRKILIACTTYVIAAGLFVSIQVSNPFGNALIPTAAYLASTLSLPFIKQFWAQNVHKKF